MGELFINQIVPIITTAIVSILVYIIKRIGDAVIELLVTKKREVDLRIASSGHEKELNTAKEVWNIVEEKFRINENCSVLLGSKMDEFNKLLLSKVPGLTQADLDYLRQAIAGEVNKYKNIESTQQVTSMNNVKKSELPIPENISTNPNLKINNVSTISEKNSNLTTNTNLKTNSNTATNTNVNANPDKTSNSNTTVTSNIATYTSPNTNSSNKDLTASSNVQVDNPDNKQFLGTTVNAISADVPN
ncbi:hypothetical protein [Clostridium sp. YIM B02555]|uniref:hypothetical protein n=1 Tax=Clostridium sp. YIM B02555 TaxID=2911968 RepID=UPI001EED52BC|nr:hypothetical protein [Clostridium sp. YIM B02555]